MIADVYRRLLKRRAAYRDCFLDSGDHPTRAAEIVLADLRRFCRANLPTATVAGGRIDPYATLLAEGRREVWNRIQHYLNLDDRVIGQLSEEPNG